MWRGDVGCCAWAAPTGSRHETKTARIRRRRLIGLPPRRDRTQDRTLNYLWTQLSRRLDLINAAARGGHVIKPWLFEFFPELSGASALEVEQYFGRYLRLWAHDEELGFEGIFFSEHHFGGSFSPSPHLLIAAM